ncbi:hypothetical protein B0H63DRAFT_251133 [Podospora didyma]|uniref:Uncharacterized protein n=1 Tax=Podospora didyma TaxID=330526 RepID=A0AAE0KLW0_9PEZI|nr:hypothetical protein B0H63DRAFT_251133 [Podospora didyma]
MPLLAGSVPIVVLCKSLEVCAARGINNRVRNRSSAVSTAGSAQYTGDIRDDTLSNFPSSGCKEKEVPGGQMGWAMVVARRHLNFDDSKNDPGLLVSWEEVDFGVAVLFLARHGLPAALLTSPCVLGLCPQEQAFGLRRGSC